MRSPPDAHARPFEETERRIETNGLVVRQIRGRSDSRLISVAMLPVQHFNDSQFAGSGRGQPPFAVDHLRQFADVQPVQNGDRMDTDKRLKSRLTDRAVYIVVRIRAV